MSLITGTLLQRLLAGVFLLTVPAVVWAHSPFAGDRQEQLAAILSALALLVLWLLWWRGARRQPPGRGRWWLFQSAMVLCVVATLGPLDHWAETNAAAHMTQHMLFMVVVAPLWVLSKPLPQMVAGGGYWLLAVASPLLKLARYPMWMAYLHGAIIWFWHIPFFYLLALENPWWHLVEHVLFLVTAGLFWWAVLHGPVRNRPMGLVALLLTLMHTGFLGAILTFAGVSLYGADRALASQQLAGLIMWVPGAVPYISAAIWLAFRWSRPTDTRPDEDAGQGADRVLSGVDHTTGQHQETGS